MKKYIATILIGFVLFFPITSYGAQAKVSVDGTSVKVGQESVVTITYSGDNIGRVDGVLTYDTAILSYISGGSSEGDAGAVQLKRAGTGDPIVFQLKFKGVKEGSTSIKVTTYEAYDLEERPMGTPTGEESIQITAEKATDPIKEDSAKDHEKENPSTDNSAAAEEDKGFEMQTLYFLISGILLVLVIIIIALVLRKKRKNRK